MTDTQTYEIRVAGQLDPGLSEWFNGMSIFVQPNGSTIIVGPVRDQAELRGLLNRIFNLNLELISLTIAP